MKNKFKKSKIIVPALALITTTTVASVTGTVAWFSANRAATVTAQFQATDSEGSLLVKTAAGVGTTVATDVDYATTNAVTVDGKLTHGSYNASTSGGTDGLLYVANISEDSTDASKYVVDGYSSKGKIEDNTGTNISASNLPWCAGEESDGSKIWYAVSWTVSLKLKTAGNTSTTKMAFVDFNKSTFSDAVDVNNGFRVAILDGEHTYIIGKDSTATHVISETSTGTWNPYHQFGESYTKVKDNASKTTAETVANGFLFELDGTEAKDLTVVAWYEGEDTNVVSKDTNKFNASDLSLNFYCRQTLTD